MAKHKKMIHLKPSQTHSTGQPETRDTGHPHGYTAGSPPHEEFEQIAESIHQWQKRPEKIEAEHRQDKEIYRKAQALGSEEKPYWQYTKVKSTAPRVNSITGRTFDVLKSRKSISMDEFTGHSLLTEDQKKLDKSTREKLQNELVNKRGWGNAWGNIRPLSSRGLARYDNHTRTIHYISS